MGLLDLFTTAKVPTSANFASVPPSSQAAVLSNFPHPVLDPQVHLLPALKALPAVFGRCFPTWAALAQPRAYLTLASALAADPIQASAGVCLAFSTYCYVMQEITGNASQVDGLWTFLPVIHATVFAFFGGRLPEPRVLLLWTLYVAWSTRLTYNAIRRGMFKKGEEDYRWPLLRQSMNRLSWELFTITFIAPAQNVLLAITALPVYVLSQLSRAEYTLLQPTRPTSILTPADVILAVLLFTNLAVQFLADAQQQRYQGFKRGLEIDCKTPLTLPADKLFLLQGGTSPAGVIGKDGRVGQQHPENVPIHHGLTNGDKKRGFVTRGLWAWSRHPNFACEQTTWWIFYAYTVITFLPPSALLDLGTKPAGAGLPHSAVGLAAKVSQAVYPSPPWWTYLLNFSALGAISMNILFIASTLYSESVSAAKYPAYASYQKRVGMFHPVDTLLRGLYYWFVAPDNVRECVEAEVWGELGDAAKKSN
ncbi:hypothetical protein V8E36_008708 [Tilletia maclaganii]